jgi:phosphoserine phosphatase RsbU/P
MFDRPDWNWRQKLDFVVATMKEMSLKTDPQDMVRSYAARVGEYLPTDRIVAVSRRGMQPPHYRITRSSLWKEEVNPWKQSHMLPHFTSGMLGDMLHTGDPRIINDLDVPLNDPAHEYLHGMGSLVATPFYEAGVASNMLFAMRKEPNAFKHEEFPGWVWMTSLFGRATGTLVLAGELREAYEALDQEMKVVANIQQSLLPTALPTIAGMDLAAHYQTSKRAGGDYYDFFPLPQGKWGILIADVSGHGTPAAVMMAITHAIAHSHPGPPIPPGKLLGYVNHCLAARYTTHNSAFVTAFYGIYDPANRTIFYASAGHPPPRVKRCEDGSISPLDQAGDLPLGIFPDSTYGEATAHLHIGDQIILFTDGITEAQNDTGDMFGTERLDRSLVQCRPDAREIIDSVLNAVASFAGDRPADDDRTLLVAKLT